MDNKELALKLHAQWQGKLDTTPKAPVATKEDLALAYTPGVAHPCLAIERDPSLAYTYTIKQNTIAVVSDGSAVLGLGNIGPAAAMPVMEGKAVLFKEFGGVNAFPICLDTQDTDALVEIIAAMAPGLGGINLEDISAPRCFEIEDRLKERLDIPVFHDDQHGTAIVVLAALINALKLTKQAKEDIRIVIAGAGAAGVAITKLLLLYGCRHILLLDRKGILHPSDASLNAVKKEMALRTNPEDIQGDLALALRGADVFIGVSGPNTVSPEMVASMRPGAILFALSNPVPEILPHLAREAGAGIIGTGRSDFPNQINNVLAFPGIFKGALEGRARSITDEMKLAAAQAIASLVSDRELCPDYIVPEAFDPRVAPLVAQAVRERI